MMLTRKQLEKRGWTFTIDGDDGSAFKDGEERFQVTSGLPSFMLIRDASALEGAPLEEPITPALVAAVSGETYVEPPAQVEIVAVPAPTVAERVAAALLDLPELSDASKQKLRDALEPAKEA
jgi:hypothetical protein